MSSPVTIRTSIPKFTIQECLDISVRFYYCIAVLPDNASIFWWFGVWTVLDGDMATRNQDRRQAPGNDQQLLLWGHSQSRMLRLFSGIHLVGLSVRLPTSYVGTSTVHRAKDDPYVYRYRYRTSSSAYIIIKGRSEDESGAVHHFTF